MSWIPCFRRALCYLWVAFDYVCYGVGWATFSHRLSNTGSCISNSKSPETYYFAYTVLGWEISQSFLLVLFPVCCILFAGWNWEKYLRHRFSKHVVPYLNIGAIGLCIICSYAYSKLPVPYSDTASDCTTYQYETINQDTPAAYYLALAILNGISVAIFLSIRLLGLLDQNDPYGYLSLLN